MSALAKAVDRQSSIVNRQSQIMFKARIAAVAALVLVTACEGLKEAMTAHVDVVAKAEGQELSVQRLSDMLGKAQFALAKPVVEQVSEVWISYQLLAKAAAEGDSLNDSTLIDRAMWPVYSQSKTGKWMERIQATFNVDTSAAAIESTYNTDATYLAAQHILFSVPAGQEATGSDSVMRRAERVRQQVNAGNFAALARQHSGDPTNKDTGGNLGVFPYSQMLAEFSQAVAALKPGEIGPLVRTQYGYHIVRRNTYPEVQQQYRQVYSGTRVDAARTAYFENMKTVHKLEVKPNAAKLVKEVAADLNGHRGDRTPVASSSLGNFTAGDVARWIGSMRERDDMRGRIQNAPDSVLPGFVEGLVLNELFLKQADSAGVTIDTAEVSAVRNAFRGLVQNTWAGLRIAPALLADSAKTEGERERLAASRVDGYLERLLAGQENFIDVPAPLAEALREKYDYSIKPAGIARALEQAQKARAVADSARAGAQPRSAVPMPDTGATKR
jgi:hypothetical protein